MRIVCPSCAARYEIADEKLARPRTVRCSRCAREWVQEPILVAGEAGETQPAPVSRPFLPQAPVVPQALVVPQADEPPEPELAPPAAVTSAPVLSAPVPSVGAMEFEPPPAADARIRQPGKAGVRLAWIASILILAALAVVAFRFRAEIQLAWPPSARLLRLLPA